VKPSRAAALAALGYSGRTSGMEALLSAMGEDSRTDRIAGEAFSAITGIAIDGELRAEERDDPEDPIPFEEDDLDADLVPGPEAELPLPDATAAAARWSTVSAGFDPAARYLHGKPLTAQGLVQGFAAASMRRRRLLALELAVRSRGSYRVETRDWAFEQLGAERRQQLVIRRDTMLPFSRLLRD
jgi:uncharacterized protein (TIGR02270 family)